MYYESDDIRQASDCIQWCKTVRAFTPGGSFVKLAPNNDYRRDIVFFLLEIECLKPIL